MTSAIQTREVAEVIVLLVRAVIGLILLPLRLIMFLIRAAAPRPVKQAQRAAYRAAHPMEAAEHDIVRAARRSKRRRR
jgi:hypothetical protein